MQQLQSPATSSPSTERCPLFCTLLVSLQILSESCSTNDQRVSSLIRKLWLFNIYIKLGDKTCVLASSYFLQIQPLRLDICLSF